jgi:hypothetical protein
MLLLKCREAAIKLGAGNERIMNIRFTAAFEQSGKFSGWVSERRLKSIAETIWK